MKLIIKLLIGSILFTSCKKDNSATVNNTAICFEPMYFETNSPALLTSVFFLNGKDGYVASRLGTIYRTSDSAKNWAALNSTTSLPIYDVYFKNANRGFAVGGESSCPGGNCQPPGAFILSTQDAGQTWNQVFTLSGFNEIYSITFVDDLLGFAVGGNFICKTTDGGQTWTYQVIPGLNGQMRKIKFVDQQNGFIVSLFDQIVKTSDGGNTWQITSLNKNRNYYAISHSEGTSFIAGQGSILKSVNNGNSWDDLPNSPSGMYDIHFINRSIGFAFGLGNYSGGDYGRYYGSMYCTTDGGNTWSGNGNFKEVGLIYKVSFPNDSIGYAISNNKLIRVKIE